MDRYYQLLDRDPSTISPLWKAGHILCFTVVIISGFIAAYALGKVEEFFGQNCVLFASISFLNENITATPADKSGLLSLPPDSVAAFNMSHTQWGSIEICNFCQFTPLCSTIFGFVWCVLFILCSRGGAGYMTDEIYRPWRLVYPAMIYTLISTAVMLGSLWQLSAGRKQFCAQFVSIFGTSSCIPAIDIYTYSFSSYQRPLVAALNVALIFTYICFFAGLTHFFFILLRIICIVDFQLIRITVVKCRPHLKKGESEDLFQDDSMKEFHFHDTHRASFAFPIKFDNDGATYTSNIVPIAKSESFDDGPPSTGNKPRQSIVYFTAHPGTLKDEVDVVLDCDDVPNDDPPKDKK